MIARENHLDHCRSPAFQSIPVATEFEADFAPAVGQHANNLAAAAQHHRKAGAERVAGRSGEVEVHPAIIRDNGIDSCPGNNVCISFNTLRSAVPIFGRWNRATSNPANAAASPMQAKPRTANRSHPCGTLQAGCIPPFANAVRARYSASRAVTRRGHRHLAQFSFQLVVVHGSPFAVRSVSKLAFCPENPPRERRLRAAENPRRLRVVHSPVVIDEDHPHAAAHLGSAASALPRSSIRSFHSACGIAPARFRRISM